MNQLTKYFAVKLVRKAINVNCIGPAVFPSNMTKNYSLSDTMAETTGLLVSFSMVFRVYHPRVSRALNAPLLAAAMHPVGRVGSPDDMAGLSLFLGNEAPPLLASTYSPSNEAPPLLASTYSPSLKFSM